MLVITSGGKRVTFLWIWSKFNTNARNTPIKNSTTPRITKFMPRLVTDEMYGPHFFGKVGIASFSAMTSYVIRGIQEADWGFTCNQYFDSLQLGDTQTLKNNKKEWKCTYTRNITCISLNFFGDWVKKTPIIFSSEFSEDAISPLIAESITAAKMPYKGNRFYK